MENQFATTANILPEVAMYYPNPYWQNSDWAKNLILFFDGIAMLIPEGMDDFYGEDDQAIIEGLKQHNLFHVLRPEILVDAEASTELAEAMIEAIGSGAFDKLDRNDEDFGSISMSRMGFAGQYHLASFVNDELKRRNLSHDSKDGISVRIHRDVRGVILVLLAQILKNKGHSLGFDFAPATDQPNYVNALGKLLSQPQMPTAGQVVSFDIQELGVDLASVPIDEVLSFRKENYAKYRDYLLHVRQFVRELSIMPEGERALAFEARQANIRQMGREIASKAEKSWNKLVSFGLGLTGTGMGVIASAQGHPTFGGMAVTGGLTRMIGALWGGAGQEQFNGFGPFSYIFKAAEKYPAR